MNCQQYCKLQTKIPHLIINKNNDDSNNRNNEHNENNSTNNKNDNSNISFKHYYLEVNQLESIPSIPSVSPFPSPIIRPISSPMTPITPLVLTESHYEKEFMQFPSSTNNNFHDSKKQYGYFQQQYQNSQYPKYLQTFTQSTTSPSSFTPNSPSPLSSGASTPTSYSTNLTNPNQSSLLNNNSSDVGSSHSSPHLNSMNTDDDDNLLLPSYYNTFLSHPHQSQTGFIPPTVVEIVNFDSENRGDIFKDLITSNSHYYHYEQNDEFQQKSQFSYNGNGINGEVDGINGISGGIGGINEEIEDNRNIHNLSSKFNIMKGESNNNRKLTTLTTLTQDDIQFHEILQGMNNMDI